MLICVGVWCLCGDHHVLGLVECGPDPEIRLRHHVKQDFLKVVAPQMWWCMLHRGGVPCTKVFGAMEKLKAVWY
eukprot:591967-Rhodomonas_salina.1